jgi:hypothetical protein
MKPLPQLPQVQTTKYQRERLRELQTEIHERRLESLRLYRPSPKQDEMHACMASERLVIGGNRSGKTLCSAIEAARAATGQDPHGKYPEKDGVLACVGRNWGHVGLVLVPYLLRAGAFKIIRDEQSGEWRAYDPARDADRKAQCKPAPPLIPPRMIKSISWVLKSANYCNSIELHNGWRIFFFSSEGEAPQGFTADLVWLDEDLQSDAWLPEMQARLADRKGRLLFSAMPHSKSESLLGLSERADRAEESGVENPVIKKFVLRFLDNAWIDAEEKAKMVERWAAQGEDVLRMRSEGEFITDSVLVYPTFHMSLHGYERERLPNHATVPDDWTRYAAIDPGHAVTAVLFAAVPPDNSMILIYDELYIRHCSAVVFAERFARAVEGQTFHSFIIDMRGGRITDIGSGRQVVEQYLVELRTRKVRSLTTGSGFMAGCDDVQARTSAVRTALHVRPDGSTRLKVLRGAAPNLERELRRYRKKTTSVNGVLVVTDEPNTRGEVHAVQCMEYVVASEPKFHARKNQVEEEPLPAWLNEYMERKKLRERGKPSVFYFGPQSDVQQSTSEMEAVDEFAQWV